MIMLTAGGCPPGQGGLRAVQNGAMTPRTSKRGLTGLQPEYLAFGFIQHAGLHLQLPCSPCRRSRPPLAHHQHPRHAQAQAVF
jgi:hypothetical protein